MRYLIVTYDDYFNIPYIRFYEEALNRDGVSYDIVLWNRSGQQVDFPNAFVYTGKDHPSKLRKLVPFLGWRRFVLRVLKRQHYDRLIILTTMPAVLLADRLLGAYKGKYWLDVRDFTYENVSFYRALVAKLVQSAAAVSISSPAFRSFLPESDRLYLTHNISNGQFEKQHCDLEPEKRPVTIGFVGGIQFYDQNRLLLRRFANHPDYHLSYVGKPHLGGDLPAFCREEGIENASFAPAFTNEQKPGIYESIQLINCVYGCDTPVSRLLLPNRLYDCVLFKKPMLVSKGTYLAEVVARYHLGIAVDPERENPVDAVDGYLKGFDREEFERGCREFLKLAHRDVEAYQRRLGQFCRGE